MRDLKLYYVPCGYRSGNFGDMFSREIVAHLSGLPTYPSGESTEEIAAADIVACGSLAEHLPAAFRGCVWGTGLMFEHSEITCAEARVTALRGKLTASRWPGRPDVPLGDPGLLVKRSRPALGVNSSPRWVVGVVPHYVDNDDPNLAEFLKRNRDTATAIDPCSPDMPERIADCECILSSSLHGLVTADALGIPNAWIVLSDRVQGGSFKFRDYLSALGVDDRLAYPLRHDRTVEEIQDHARSEWTWGDRVEQVANDLADAFPDFSDPVELEPEPIEPTPEAEEAVV